MSTEMTGDLQSAYGAFSPKVLHQQIQMIQQAMSDCMTTGVHYGVVPGCGDKPTLLKPGAEKLCFMFRLAPEYKIDLENLGNGHREYRITCRLTSIATGAFVGEGVGSACTMETKYRYRQSERTCPACGNSCIIKGRKEYDKTGGDGGWLCFKKKGGCGAQFSDNDKRIESQQVGRMENPDIADCYNSCLKIAKKRAGVDAVLTATAASDIFAQDLEDLPPQAGDSAKPPAAPKGTPQQPTEDEWTPEEIAREEALRDKLEDWKRRTNACEKDDQFVAIFKEMMALPKGPEREGAWNILCNFQEKKGNRWDGKARKFVPMQAA